MASSDSGNGVSWPELKLPPINLWVLASSSVLSHEREDTHNHRSQRPDMKGNHEKTLHYLMAGTASNAPKQWRAHLEPDFGHWMSKKHENRTFHASASKKALDGFFAFKTNPYDRMKEILAMRGGTNEH